MGVVWQWELPWVIRRFDDNTITDVIFHLQYTAHDGGQKLRQLRNYAIGLIEQDANRRHIRRSLSSLQYQAAIFERIDTTVEGEDNRVVRRISV
jgi:hypothetical protein